MLLIIIDCSVKNGIVSRREQKPVTKVFKDSVSTSESQLPEVADNNLKNALELNENAYRRTEKWLSFFMLISTLVAISIIILLPTKKLGFALTVLLIALVVILAFIGNTVNIVAMIYNKERSGAIEPDIGI